VEYLTVNEALLLHARLIQRTGGSRGVRDVGLLESALTRSQATFEGADLYPDLWAKAAALMHGLAQNHAFVDGNQRTALTSAGIFLELNGHRLTASNGEAAGFTLRIAAGQLGVKEIAAWLKTHSQARQS
jgi:death-on-curing protein